MQWKPLSGLPLVILTLALGLGTFIQVLDITVANVSIPAIAGDLGVSSQEGTWVITSFAVSNAIVLPLTGWFSARFGQVRLFVLATGLFSILSWLCGLAGNLTILAFFRALQGAVAGLLMPLSQSLLMLNYEEHKKGIALGFWSMIIIVAPIAGPVLGGWITDNWGWRWIFYINIPLGLLSSLLTWRILSQRETPQEKTPVDVIGFLLLIASVGSAQLFLDLGNNLDWFSSSFVTTLACVAVIGFCFFLAWTKYSSYPLIDFSFFRHASYTVSMIVVSVGFMVYFGSVVLLPFWLQTDLGYTAIWAGLSLAPGGILVLVLSPIVGKYLYKFDLRLVISISCVIFAITFFMFSKFTTEVTFWQLIVPRFISGAAIALFTLPLTALSLAEIPRAAYASASGVTTFARTLVSMGFGTVLSMVLWQQRTSIHKASLTDSLNMDALMASNTLESFHALGFDSNSINSQMDKLLNDQASMLALNEYFWLGGWIFIFLIPLLWLSPLPDSEKIKNLDVIVE